jgi:hypothetical protein
MNSTKAVPRELENIVWLIHSDVAGRTHGLVSHGSSGIVDPDGMVVRSARLLSGDLIVAEIYTACTTPRVGCTTGSRSHGRVRYARSSVCNRVSDLTRPRTAAQLIVGTSGVRHQRRTDRLKLTPGWSVVRTVPYVQPPVHPSAPLAGVARALLHSKEGPVHAIIEDLIGGKMDGSPSDPKRLEPEKNPGSRGTRDFGASKARAECLSARNGKMIAKKAAAALWGAK